MSDAKICVKCGGRVKVTDRRTIALICFTIGALLGFVGLINAMFIQSHSPFMRFRPFDITLAFGLGVWAYRYKPRYKFLCSQCKSVTASDSPDGYSPKPEAEAVENETK